MVLTGRHTLTSRLKWQRINGTTLRLSETVVPAIFTKMVKLLPKIRLKVQKNSVLPTSNFRIGNWVLGGREWNGIVDEAFLFERAWSKNEIKSIFKLGLEGAQPVSPKDHAATCWWKTKKLDCKIAFWFINFLQSEFSERTLMFLRKIRLFHVLGLNLSWKATRYLTG